MIIIIGIVLFIIAVVCFLGIYLIFNNIISVNNESKFFKILGIVGVICSIIGFIICFSSGAFDNSDSNNNSNWSEEASKECRNRTNTYYKCSWSVIEDRCVCKQR